MTHWAALISVSVALSRHQLIMRDHEYGASASRGVSVYSQPLGRYQIILLGDRLGLVLAVIIISVDTKLFQAGH